MPIRTSGRTSVFDTTLMTPIFFTGDPTITCFSNFYPSQPIADYAI